MSAKAYTVRFTEATGKPWYVTVTAVDEAQAIAITKERYEWAQDVEIAQDRTITG